MKTSVVQHLAGLAGLAVRGLTGAADVDPAITATGASSQANSYGLKATMNIVTAGGANTGVRVGTDLAVGDDIDIYNISGGTILVYPDGTNQINNAGASTAVNLVNNTWVKLKRMTTTQYAMK